MSEFDNAVDTIPEILYGKVLQGGLGVGELTSWLLQHDIELTTIEINPDVIAAFDNDNPKHTIIEGDFLQYYDAHKDEYDFIVHDIPQERFKYSWLKTGRNWQWVPRY